MNIETFQAYPKSHFGPCRANGTLEHHHPSGINAEAGGLQKEEGHPFCRTRLQVVPLILHFASRHLQNGRLKQTVETTIR